MGQASVIISGANACRHPADRLYQHLITRHVREDGAVVGPDMGVRLNSRVWRFAKSVLRVFPWGDMYYYAQAQAYWVYANIHLHRLTGNAGYEENAVRCADVLLARQMPEGYWEYPNTEWKGLIATVDNCFAALALLTVYETIRDERYLDAARRWYDYMIDEVGFQHYDDDSLAVSYFANRGRGLVPNNSTLAIWFCALLNHATGDAKYLEYCAPMVSFLTRCQLDSGELPYSLTSEQGQGRDHYLCFQYNAFELMDLIEYQRISGDESVLPIVSKLTEFVSMGLTENGDGRHDCAADRPVTNYYTAAVSAALVRATQAGLGDYSKTASRGYARLISRQARSGAFDYSLGDYGFLSDRRSYPRSQCMILRHLLIGAELGSDGASGGADA